VSALGGGLPLKRVRSAQVFPPFFFLSFPFFFLCSGDNDSYISRFLCTRDFTANCKSSRDCLFSLRRDARLLTRSIDFLISSVPWNISISSWQKLGSRLRTFNNLLYSSSAFISLFIRSTSWSREINLTREFDGECFTRFQLFRRCPSPFSLFLAPLFLQSFKFF
jgi:hypothetical protein